MIRARFKANADDWRPVKFPPPGPCWCTGYGFTPSFSTIVGYFETVEQITEFWPEATEVKYDHRDKITFTDRFACPEWWDASKEVM
jgi:hypothetical protein